MKIHKMTLRESRELHDIIVNNKYQLFSAQMFYYSPISEMVEERHIFAESNIETYDWAESMNKRYTELDMIFAIYINGNRVYSRGNVGDHLVNDLVRVGN